MHHALCNILEPIFEKTFIYDSYASRKCKGTHAALKRFDYFKRKVSQNGTLISNQSRRGGYCNLSLVKGYCLKADIKHYFETVDHETLLQIIKRKIKDERVIWLIKQILNNYNAKVKGKGMPLGNFTSQFFANVYLNELDNFIKRKLRVKYYIRYVDDFAILSGSKNEVIEINNKLNDFLLSNLSLELHQDKTIIKPIYSGIKMLGYRIFYYHKRLRKSNLRKFKRDLSNKLILLNNEELSKEKLINSFQGWQGYAIWANTYKLRRQIISKINKL